MTNMTIQLMAGYQSNEFVCVLNDLLNANRNSTFVTIVLELTRLMKQLHLRIDRLKLRMALSISK
jgi:hypothetical protein